jgi:ATP-dependent Clp protease adaptor protein ClpS
MRIHSRPPSAGSPLSERVTHDSLRAATGTRAVPMWRTPYSGGVSIAPVELEKPDSAQELARDVPWVTIVWNDPINTMSYVTYVFQSYFGYPRSKAEKLMRDVHEKGRAVVSTGSREEMERDTEAMHEFGLWATFRKDD